MKKIIKLFLIFTLFLTFQSEVKASDFGIENFNMYVTVEANGDLYVREAFIMNGNFHGMDRDIEYKNSSAKPFTKDKESLNGSDIYNGTAIELVQIRAIPYEDFDSILEMQTKGTKFKKVTEASEGDFGVYTESKTDTGISFRIYNPSNEKKFFYLEYIIKNMAVVHNDVAEIGWNIFSDNFRESIHHFKADIYIPGNTNLLRGYAHGPLVGNIQLDGKEHLEITISELYEHTEMDTRFIFDKEVISNVQKKSEIDAFETIVEIETEKAEIANQEREQYRKELERQKQINKIMSIGAIILGINWMIGIIIIVIYVYKKHDKEYETTLKTKYFRDFPADYNPSTVGYLFHRTVSNNDLSACLLNLIYKKIVTFEPIEKNNYKLIYHPEKGDLNAADQQLIKLIFKENEITLKELKQEAKTGYNSFLQKYHSWRNIATKEAMAEQFFENKNAIKAICSLYSIIGIIISIFAMNYILPVGVILFVFALITFIYFLAFTKKTQKGIEHYSKWNGLKNFMKDFGTMDKKELPEIVLWEKYLVYAVSLGCADKLEKTMQLRIREFHETDLISINYSIHTMRDMMIFNQIISSSLTTAVNNAYSAQSIANSSNSSGGGFGGGFSGGGGSFGGGSGGGRF